MICHIPGQKKSQTGDIGNGASIYARCITDDGFLAIILKNYAYLRWLGITQCGNMLHSIDDHVTDFV